MLALLILMGVGVCTIWLVIFKDLPTLENLSDLPLNPSVRVVDRNGQLLYEIMDEHGGRHTVVPVDRIPDTMRLATLATEDKNFYQHPGFDLFGVARSMWINLQGGETIAGGSTITQQVARNLLMTAEERSTRSLQRKLREIILAWQIENVLEKDDILALYLNQTYYGGLSYGVEAAAQTFFGKAVDDLDLAESALIAGLPQAPAIYNPYTSFEEAKARQEVVLNLMEEAGWISSEAKQQAIREPLILAETPYPVEAPHFVMMVRSELDKLFSPEEILDQGGLVVVTTLDLDWQRLAEQAIARQLKSLSISQDGLGHNVNNAALVALDPHNGEILALVGSPDFFDHQQGGAINMAISPRQPGSALKPVVYAAALDPTNPTGSWTAATMLLDVSTAFQTHDNKAYIPANYDLREHGPVLVREALASSLNIPAVITLEHIGLQSLADYATKFGITTLNNPHTYDLSLALGGGSVRLIELTSAYGVFANGGYRVNPKEILEVRNTQDEVLYQSPKMESRRVLDERVAWLISDILSDDQARRLGFGPNTVLQIDRPAAVKTGTTSNFHDNWTVGYTPNLVVGVWTGNTSYAPMRDVDGLSGAAPIWHDFIRSALSGSQKMTFQQPEGFVQVEICALSGLLPSEVCPYRKLEWFIENTQPSGEDHYYRVVTVDSGTGVLLPEGAAAVNSSEILVLDLPDQARQWAHSQGLVLLKDLVKDSDSQSLQSAPLTTPGLSIASPANGSQYYLSTFTDRASQRIMVEVSGTLHLSEIEIVVDGIVVQRLGAAPFRIWWVLEPGEHQIWATGVTQDGKRITSEPVNISIFSW